ncbi:DUF2971 domain-containing protein [Flavobacterium sandaracinum]|uniref:DUF2971 domain-containing protein n=1 Tax=Flavobacterium sandaracinum TaxID=2541733 RepID=A0A4R5D250_9FLAO|nr:DUF2971 domain-containing protein [Flavobacterium sandaracinum]TDE07339.1 DUF2971 domain-containing protein [Flavobacterium sandaracinum]
MSKKSNQIEKELNEFLEGKLPNKLYHYTNLNGLKGILENSEIWLSNMYFLNDKNEFELGLRFVVEQLEAYKGGFSVLKPTKYFIEALEKAIDFIKEKDSPYILSMTTNNDLLSQWRGYTNNGVGVNIGFSNRFFEENKLKVYKCIYEVEKQKEIINHILTQSIFMFIRVADSQGIFKDSEEIELSKYDKAVSAAGQYFIDRTMFFCSLIKDKSFVEEDEWRLLLFDEKSEINFLNKGNYFRPYQKIKIDNLNDSINEVMMGPNSEKELCHLSLKMLFNKYKIEIKKLNQSKIPYRN